MYATTGRWAATGANDGIVLEVATTCSNLIFSGSGTTSIARFRPLGYNPNNLNVVIDQDMTFKYNSVSFTGYYNSTANNNSENVTITINGGKTVSLANPSGQFHLGSGTTAGNPQGSVTYNLNGTLDVSATTASNMVPSSVNPASNTIMNINNGGVLKTGVSFGLTNITAPTTTYGLSRININDGGMVDAVNTTTLNASSVAASGFFVINGTGVFKRRAAGTAITYPAGTSGTNYNPVTITNTGTADNFSLSLKNSFDTPPVAPARVVNKQWDITEEVPGGSNVSLKLGWTTTDQAAGFDPGSAVSIMHFTGTAWEYTPATVTGTGTITDPYMATASNLTSFSPFGVINTSGTLPLTLLSFKGANNNGYAELNWTTTNEINTDHFVVEKSTDNRTFTEAGTLTAKGTAGTTTYRLTDASALTGTAYYRLKMVDKDGRFTYSMVVMLSAKNTMLLAVYPNPAQGTVVVTHPLTGAEASLELIAADGRTVKSYVLAAGHTSSAISISNLPKGTYIVRFTTNKQTATTRLIK